MTESSPTNPDGSKSFSSGRAADDNKTPITVYDPTYFHNEHTHTQEGGTGSHGGFADLTEETRFRAATAQERFSAFCADLLLFAPLAWGLAGLLGIVLKSPPSALLLGLAVGGLHLVYYFATEALWGASPGKKLAGLRLRRVQGGRPSSLEIGIRTLSRLIDYPFVFVTVGGFMESTERTQRLGDVAAGTMVVYDSAFDADRLPPDETPLAGATRRAAAWAIDMIAFVLPFFYGVLLVAPSSHPALQSALAVAALPLTIVGLSLSETFFRATPGKALLGLTVAQEDGRPARFPSLWLRNAFKLFDANPLGYLCTLLSSRKQRPGDTAAGTLVFREGRGRKRWLSLPTLILPAVLLFAVGIKNPDSFLRRNLPITVAGRSLQPLPDAVKRLPFLNLGIFIEDLKLGLNEQEENPSKAFVPGQPIYLLFRLTGYLIQADKAWVQADVKVKDPHGNLVLDKMNVINSSLPVGSRRSAKLITRFSLNPQAEVGLYQVTLKIRDMFGGRYVEQTETFTVR